VRNISCTKRQGRDDGEQGVKAGAVTAVVVVTAVVAMVKAAAQQAAGKQLCAFV
jgi:hypothetical protein